MARKQESLSAARRWPACASIVVGLCLATAMRASAADRPSEDQMFGGGTSDAGVSRSAAGADGGAASPAPPPARPDPSLPAQASPPAGAELPSRDEALLGEPNAGPRLSQDVAPDDPLRIGGQLYLRALSQATEGQAVQNLRFSAPALVDAYFDARPNDRVRGFVLGRLLFDPTLPTLSTMPTSAMSSNGVPGLGPSVPLLSGVQSQRGPTAVLDQLWVRFDVERIVFVTAGRQHVKWGTARFWTPTDYLHPLRRNPVAVFDARPGFTMLKAHVPWEARGWNFYGFGLVEGTRQLDKASGRYQEGTDATSTIGQLGGAARAEVVLGTSELGLDGVFYRGQKPRLGADLSLGIGDFDLYVDAGLRYGSELPRRGYNSGDVPLSGTVDQWLDSKYPLYYSTGVKPQVTVGGTYSAKYNDNDVFTIIGEYFYNSRGYDDPHIYPGLFLTNTFEFFYTGRHYAALGAVAAAPGSWNYTTFTLTTLGNFSDQSFITRLDYSLILLTHLRFEAFGAVNYGRREGEFRLGVNGFMLPDGQTFSLAPQSFSLGLGLRVSL